MGPASAAILGRAALVSPQILSPAALRVAFRVLSLPRHFVPSRQNNEGVGRENIMTTTSTVELIEAHPALIQLETNIRTEAALDAGFLAAIRANGVLTPVLGHRNDDGTVTVRAGQRRVLAAREVGLETVPVYLVPVDAEGVEDKRIIHQLVENEHRDSMTNTGRLAA